MKIERMSKNEFLKRTSGERPWLDPVRDLLKNRASNYAAVLNNGDVEVRGITGKALVSIAADIAVSAINSDRRRLLKDLHKSLTGLEYGFWEKKNDEVVDSSQQTKE